MNSSLPIILPHGTARSVSSVPLHRTPPRMRVCRIWEPNCLQQRFCSKGSRLVRGIVMRPPFRSKQDVIINAPLEAVWSFSMDLTKIPEFHPRVFKVDLLAGKAFREPGVSYQCHLSGGKHTCIEKDIEIVPLE